MRQLILIRHSESQPIPGAPQETWGLTAAGIARCRPLAEQLRPYQVAVIAASYERKAQETAAHTAAFLHIPVITQEGIEEQARTGAPFFHDREAFLAAVARLFTHPTEQALGEETGQQAQVRFSAAVNQLLAAYPEQTVALVTHGRVLTSFLAHHTHIDPLPFWQSLTMPCFIVLEYEAGELRTKQPTVVVL
ncbi:MAG: histidine phosphatase family protein [Anaerolineales bacterium]|nr:histidine phosphatase family protein [Anaerolineales bacterium]